MNPAALLLPFVHSFNPPAEPSAGRRRASLTPEKKGSGKKRRSKRAHVAASRKRNR